MHRGKSMCLADVNRGQCCIVCLGLSVQGMTSSENLICNHVLAGRATKGQPYVVATKFGLVVSEAGISTNNKPEYVRCPRHRPSHLAGASLVPKPGFAAAPASMDFPQTAAS